MTKFASDCELVPGGWPDDASQTSVADDPHLVAELIVSAWDSFIPKIGERVLQTEPEMRMWERLPQWQKNALRFQDPDLLAEGPEVVKIVGAIIAELGRDAISEATRKARYMY